MNTENKPRNTLDQVANTHSRSLLVEIVGLLRANRKWWLLPILLLILALALLLILGGSGAAPFIYSIF